MTITGISYSQTPQKQIITTKPKKEINAFTGALFAGATGAVTAPIIEDCIKANPFKLFGNYEPMESVFKNMKNFNYKKYGKIGLGVAAGYLALRGIKALCTKPADKVYLKTSA